MEATPQRLRLFAVSEYFYRNEKCNTGQLVWGLEAATERAKATWKRYTNCKQCCDMDCVDNKGEEGTVGPNGLYQESGNIHMGGGTLIVSVDQVTKENVQDLKATDLERLLRDLPGVRVPATKAERLEKVLSLLDETKPEATPEATD
jgi:hypothetical protein